MDVKLSIGEEDVVMNNSITEVKKDEGGAFVEMLEDEMDPLEEEEIWRSRRERMNSALAAAQTVLRQDPAKVYAAARRLADVIKEADIEEFMSVIERLACHSDLSAILSFEGLSRGSLLHIAAGTGKDDILRLLVDSVADHLIAAQNDWGDTPLHLAAKAGGSRATAMLIHRARDLPNIEIKYLLRMKNKHGNTALHEAVLNCHANVVRRLLREDLEPVYWKNADQKSPLYLALDTRDSAIHDVLFSLSLEPSRIEGLPPVHGAIMRKEYDLVVEISKKNMKLFAMADSGGGNAFHLAAYKNRTPIFELLRPETEYLAREKDMDGHLPIHIASKMGHVELIEKLYPVSHLLNRRGQTVLHVAAKYGRTSAVRYILRHPELGMLINERDHDGNTPLHLAAIHSQPATLIPLMQDERIQLILLNHECLTALDVALESMRREYAFRKLMAFMVLEYMSAVSIDLLVLRPEARDKAYPTYEEFEKKTNMEQAKDVINTRLLVAALVATVTFAAGFAVPGGFNSLDKASKDKLGMAMMLDKTMFHAFVICNTIAMFCSMIAAVNLMMAQQCDVLKAVAAYQHSKLPLTIALPAMSAAFITGVTLTVGKLPWLAHSIFYLGLVFLLVILGAKLLEYPQFFCSRYRPIRLTIFWLFLAYINWWGVERHLPNDSEEDEKASGTSASQPLDGAVESNDL
ncbi:protein ACCELERATED CELL DEATH 6-like [Syzygium oleosum]|uniref:protein ACCELERATED CELL DEATH 6-like n=1 Tax=Syzygium oleosum TaxID=219896 RepID=UPI0024B8CE12|nr:protein ACCELERATED CELL DEATH 6-like [Syzygium oleosum]